jgi:hypothetical protein
MVRAHGHARERGGGGDYELCIPPDIIISYSLIHILHTDKVAIKVLK